MWSALLIGGLGAAALDIVEQNASPLLDCASPANPVVRENCLAGSPPHEWDINAAGHTSIQGFASPFSVNLGEEVAFKVRTDANNFRLDIYRAGYYEGLGARKVATLAGRPHAQPACLTDAETRLVDCSNWFVSAAWRVPQDMVSGVYFARLVRTDLTSHWRTDASQSVPELKFANPDFDYAQLPPCGKSADCARFAHSYGAHKHKAAQQGAAPLLHVALKEPVASHAFFIVRDDSRSADFIFQTADLTWLAYNRFENLDTYAQAPLARWNFTVPPGQPLRAYKKSYNCPLITRDTRSINTFFGAEYPMVRFLERFGYDVSYWAGKDTHRRGAELVRFRGFLSVGHDEYWSGPQREHVTKARDAGVSLAFLSGNEVYWRVRLEASADGQPEGTMVVYKESASSSKLDPAMNEWTGTFRDSATFNPLGAHPENSLTGTIFTVNAWRNDPLMVPHQYAPLRFWRDTPVERLRPPQVARFRSGILGHEWDEDIDNGFRPPGLIRLSETTIHNLAYIVDTGSSFDSGSATHHLTFYRHVQEVKQQGQGLVFGAGTVQWSWGLDDFHDAPTGSPNEVECLFNTRVLTDPQGAEPALQQATMNIFADMHIWPTALLPGHLVRPNATDDLVPPRVTVSGMDHASNTLWGTAEDNRMVAAVEVLDGRWRAAELGPPGHLRTWQFRYQTAATHVRAVDDSGWIGTEVAMGGRAEL